MLSGDERRIPTLRVAGPGRQVCRTIGYVGRVAAPSTTGNPITLLLAHSCSVKVSGFSLSPRREVPLPSGPSMEVLGVPLFEICLSLSRSSMSLLYWVM